MRVNKMVVHELRETERRLKALCAVGDSSSCGVDDEHKQAVRLYVGTWITPLVQSALDRIEGRKKTSRGECR